MSAKTKSFHWPGRIPIGRRHSSNARPPPRRPFPKNRDLYQSPERKRRRPDFKNSGAGARGSAKDSNTPELQPVLDCEPRMGEGFNANL